MINKYDRKLEINDVSMEQHSNLTIKPVMLYAESGGCRSIRNYPIKTSSDSVDIHARRETHARFEAIPDDLFEPVPDEFVEVAADELVEVAADDTETAKWNTPAVVGGTFTTRMRDRVGHWSEPLADCWIHPVQLDLIGACTPAALLLTHLEELVLVAECKSALIPSFRDEAILKQGQCCSVLA